jgi:hypothetical protein
MKYGTAHFRTKIHAARYYEPYGYDRDDVEAKFEAGEIFVGPPALLPGDRLTWDTDGRAWIETTEAAQ